MIVEVRTYKIKPGRRDEFIRFFESRSVPALRAHGMDILGPLLDLENPDTFVFLRSFPSLETREEMKSAFYDGPVWKNELQRCLGTRTSPLAGVSSAAISASREPAWKCGRRSGRSWCSA